MQDKQHKHTQAAAVGVEPSSRRGFFAKAAVAAIGGVLAAVPLAAGLVALFYPLKRKGVTNEFVRITSLDSVPADGIPRRFSVAAEHFDAWTGHGKAQIGAVYLRRTSFQEVEALNSICPHAGCFVDVDLSRHRFHCPCHNSAFTLDGAVIQPSPSPRPMDPLEVELRERDGVKEVWVKFENFVSGTAAKIART